MTKELANFYADYVSAMPDAIQAQYGPAKLTTMWLEQMDGLLRAGVGREAAEAFTLSEIKEEVYAADADLWFSSTLTRGPSTN